MPLSGVISNSNGATTAARPPITAQAAALPFQFKCPAQCGVWSAADTTLCLPTREWAVPTRGWAGSKPKSAGAPGQACGIRRAPHHVIVSASASSTVLTRCADPRVGRIATGGIPPRARSLTQGISSALDHPASRSGRTTNPGQQDLANVRAITLPCNQRLNLQLMSAERWHGGDLCTRMENSRTPHCSSAASCVITFRVGRLARPQKSRPEPTGTSRKRSS